MSEGHTRRYRRDVPDDVPYLLPDPSPARLLAALAECAVDLVELRDPRLVLQALVRRTRLLLGSDLAYLSLNDLAAGETHIEITDGVRTEAYRTIRMPLGTGVLGAVAAGGTDVQTTDYLADPAMNHLDRIDAIVADEQVRAIHGCPVRARGRVVAALLVAHRSPTRFSRRQTTALRRLAEQAAIALEQLREPGSSDLDHDEDDLVLRVPDGPHAVLDLLGEWLARPVELHGPDEPLPSSDAPAAAQDAYRTAVAASRHTHEAVRTGTDDGAPGTPGTVLACCRGDQHLATVLVHTGTDVLDERSRRLLARAGPVVAAAVEVQRRLVDAEQRTRTDLVDELVHAERITADLRARLAAVGFARRGTIAVYVVTTRDRPVPGVPAVAESVAGSVAESAATSAAVLVAAHRGAQCVIAQVTDPARFAAQLRDALAPAGPVVGWALAPGGLADVARAHEVAHRAAAALHAIGTVPASADPSTLGLAGMLAAGTDPAVVAALIEHQVGPLLSYDRRHRTELTRTARTVLESGNLRAAAAQLHLHVNTVRQRCDRIAALLGPDWSSPGHAGDRLLALRLWAVRGALEEAG